MNLKTAFAAASLVFAAAAAAPSDASASNYPPDYVTCGSTDYQYTGPFELIRATTSTTGHRAKLTIAYRGYLRDHFADSDINFYINLNGSDIFADASSGTNNDAYTQLIAGPRNCHMCVEYQSPPGSDCAQYVANGGSWGSWLCQYETPDEQEIFTWAYNQYNQQNAWDIQLAAEANGWWDSNYGNNYYARFEPRTTCN